METRTIRYDDGRWCEQQYVDGKLNGTWTVFHADGQREWERQHAADCKEGYFRRWDATGRLIEEQWYHLNELHGLWRRWDEAGREEVIGDFQFGYPRPVFDETVNPDFNQLIKPHYGREPAEFSGEINDLLARMRRKSLQLKKMAMQGSKLTERGSFWSHVNILAVGEEWPCFRDEPLIPILQLNCAEIALPDNPLAEFSFITLFAIAGDVIGNLGEDIVIRTYRRDDELITIDPPCVPLESPKCLSFVESETLFPDENDLPPGLRLFLKDSTNSELVIGRDDKLNSRLGGWPGWLQSGRLSGFGRFAFQIDSLDVENWECGDCTIHYFFLSESECGFTWVQEMC